MHTIDRRVGSPRQCPWCLWVDGHDPKCTASRATGGCPVCGGTDLTCSGCGSHYHLNERDERA